MKVVFLALMAFSFHVQAELPFDLNKFNESQKNNEKILVLFHASWCPVCKNEDKIFKKLNEEEFFKLITVYRADFDKETQMKMNLNIKNPGSIILYSGNKEVSRVSGISTEIEMKRFVDNNLLKP